MLVGKTTIRRSSGTSVNRLAETTAATRTCPSLGTAAHSDTPTGWPDPGPARQIRPSRDGSRTVGHTATQFAYQTDRRGGGDLVPVIPPRGLYSSSACVWVGTMSGLTDGVTGRAIGCAANASVCGRPEYSYVSSEATETETVSVALAHEELERFPIGRRTLPKSTPKRSRIHGLRNADQRYQPECSPRNHHSGVPTFG